MLVQLFSQLTNFLTILNAHFAFDNQSSELRFDLLTTFLKFSQRKIKEVH